MPRGVLIRNFWCASGPRVAFEGVEVTAEAQREVSGREMAVTVRMRELMRVVGAMNWIMAKMAGGC